MLRALEANLALHRKPPRVEARGKLVWYAVHTKAREEMKAATNLKDQLYGVFYPRERVTVRHAQKRNVVVERPLFPRYLFVEMGEAESIAPINATSGVSTIVHVPNAPPLAIPRGVIDDIMALVNDAGLAGPEVAARFVVGQEVAIELGPFAGFLAIIERIEGENIRAFVRIFGRETPVVLDEDSLRARVDDDRYAEDHRASVLRRRRESF